MGGLGALHYASARPDLFGWVASFSGAVDVSAPTFQARILSWLWDRGHDPFALFGDPISQARIWRAHNPLHHAAAFRGLRVILTTRNGWPGPLDPRGALFDVGEAEIHRASLAMHRRLDGLGIPHAWRAEGNGTHAWPYWQRDLRRWLPDFLSQAA